MAGWFTKLLERVKRLAAKKLGPQTPIAELRAHYQKLAEAFHKGPEAVVERAQLGQVKGEWVRVPESQPQRLLLYFHGGGYICGSPETHRPLIARLCKAAGAAALAVDYRLGPEFPFPAGLRDAVDAYRFLTSKGIAPDSLVLAGDGSGGGLAFAAAMAIRNAGLPMPAAVVAMSPWADMTLSGWSMMQNAATDAQLSWDFLFLNARHYLKTGSPADSYASPVFGNLRDFPPIMVHCGSLEILRDDASRLGALASAANVPVSVEVYDGMPHLFQATGAREAEISLNRLGQFIRTRTLGAESPDVRKGARREAKT